MLALASVAAGGYRISVYMHENATWSTAHGLLLGHTPGPLSEDDDGAGGFAAARDDFSVDHGPVSLCHWDDPYAAWVPALGRVRAVARSRHWGPGTRVRLRLDPAQPGACRPAYGWPEFVRLDLTGYVLLTLLLGGGAWFVYLGRRA